MFVSIDQKLSRQGLEEIVQEVAVAHLEGVARESREPRPYVVRDLSWELARYLDAEPVSASASAASSPTGGKRK
jgi:hypothetical protein